MRKYKVVLSNNEQGVVGSESSFFVEADEVTVDAIVDSPDGIHYVFTVEPEEEAAYIVAFVPFNNVRYIVIQP